MSQQTSNVARTVSQQDQAVSRKITKLKVTETLAQTRSWHVKRYAQVDLVDLPDALGSRGLYCGLVEWLVLFNVLFELMQVPRRLRRILHDRLQRRSGVNYKGGME